MRCSLHQHPRTALSTSTHQSPHIRPKARSVVTWTNSWGQLRVVGLGGGFKHFLCSSLFGEMIQFDEHIFQMGWNHQLGSCHQVQGAVAFFVVCTWGCQVGKKNENEKMRGMTSGCNKYARKGLYNDTQVQWIFFFMRGFRKVFFGGRTGGVWFWNLTNIYKYNYLRFYTYIYDLINSYRINTYIYI